MKKAILFLVVILAAYYLYGKSDSGHGPGMLAPEDPEQHTIFQSEPFKKGSYWVAPLAKFRLKAVVLSKKYYDAGDFSDLVPVDIAFGWGEMSDRALLDEITVTQARRRYKWSALNTIPVTGAEVSSHSANMHLIPANANILSSIDDIEKGDLIELQGYLVRAEEGERYWNSSMTRLDKGDGSCELVWVEDIRVL